MTAPSAWIRRFAGDVAAGSTVLDVACGGGRHSLLFRDQGAAVTAIDRDISAIAGLKEIEIIAADLETGAPWPLGGRRFDCVVVTNYLWRPILPDILAAVGDGGLLLYETFAAGNEAFGRPSRPEFLLRPGELLEITRDAFEVRAYEHGYGDSPSPGVRQRISALRTGPGSASACTT
ncbi:MAG: SAM-dependent methyltransferase [Hyphomicrobiales bacterium]|nr:MAG: SAM-dependent methyltransferase [Hyphomicrobiales bacterium]